MSRVRHQRNKNNHQRGAESKKQKVSTEIQSQLNSLVQTKETEEGFLDTLKVKYNTDISQEEQNTEDHIHIMALSGHLLEHILTFLPTKYIGLMLRCCTRFYNEIGTHSPGLWKFLLKRHGWSMGADKDYVDADDAIACHRNLFIDHYSICQQVDALSEGVLELDGQRDNDQLSRMNAVFFFEESMYLPSKGDQYWIAFWDENTVLVASQVDCFVRLVSISNTNGQSVCNEILSTRFAPGEDTRTSKWYLESVAVDDRYLVFVFERTLDSLRHYVVATTTKQDFLTVASDDPSNLHPIFQYHCINGLISPMDGLLFQSIDENMKKRPYREDDLLQLVWNHEKWRVKLELYGDIQPCGDGMFVAVGSFELGEEEVMSGWLMISASGERNVIVGYDSLPFRTPLCSTNFRRKTRADMFDIVIGSPSMNNLLVLDFDKDAILQDHDNDYLYYGSGREDGAVLSEYKLLNGRNVITARLCIKSSNENGHPVIIYIHQKEVDIQTNSSSSSEEVPSPYNHFEADSDIAPCSVELKERYDELLSINFLHNEKYLLLICEKYIEGSIDNRLDFIIVHVDSKLEIHCYSIYLPLNDYKWFFRPNQLISLKVQTTEDGAIIALLKDVGIVVAHPAKCYYGHDDDDDDDTRVKDQVVYLVKDHTQ